MNLKKRASKSIALALGGIIFITPFFDSISAASFENSYIEIEHEMDYEEFERYPDLELSNEEVIMVNEYIRDLKNNNVKSRRPRSIGALAGWAGSFAIPGVGPVVITATGIILVSGAAVATGSWIGNTIKNWVARSKEQEAENAKNKVPSRLKKKNGNVDLGAFDRKVSGGKAVRYKNGKTGWQIEKDTTKHRGYDGSVKEWKLLDRSGNRIGSLNGNGKVIDK